MNSMNTNKKQERLLHKECCCNQILEISNTNRSIQLFITVIKGI